MDVEETSALSTGLGTIVFSTTCAAVPFRLVPYFCCRFDLNLDFDRLQVGSLALALNCVM